MNGAVPPPRSLGEGIHLIPTPLPFPSPSWVNCYALEVGEGLTLIDCGCDWPPGYDALRAGLAEVVLAGAPIHTLIVSHLHPDHVGMADRIRAEDGARLVMHRRAAHRMDRYNDTPGFVARNLELAERHGVPGQEAGALAGDPTRPEFMGDYLNSLARLLEIPIGLTYPAHGGIIERGSARVEQILLHHDRRLDQMRKRAESLPTTAWEMMAAVFRPPPLPRAATPRSAGDHRPSGASAAGGETARRGP